MTENGLYLYLGVYPTAAAAEADFEDLAKLYSSGRFKTYDAAVVSKDTEGRIHVKKHEKPTQRAAWSGIGVGAVLGVLFPPSIIVTAAVGGVAGGLVGHLWKGMSRADVKELGEALDADEAALLVVAPPEVKEQAARILSRSRQRVVKRLDLDHHQFAEALVEAEKQQS